MKTTRQIWFALLVVSLLALGGRAEPPVTTATTKPAPKLTILKAEYGALPDGESADVTEKVRSMVKGDALKVDATNDNFGDPAEGIVKTLRVQYQFGDGAKLSKSVAENETLVLQNPGAIDPQALQVLKAEYGDLPDGRKTDVTQKVQDLLRDGQLTVAATNDNFGDPAEGTVKTLRVEYTFKGQRKTAEVEEGETLTLPPKD